jgi:hypothetical protein
MCHRGRSMTERLENKKCLLCFWSGLRNRSTSTPQLNSISSHVAEEGKLQGGVLVFTDMCISSNNDNFVPRPRVLPDPPRMHILERPKYIVWLCVQGSLFVVKLIQLAISHAWRKLTALAVVQWQSTKCQQTSYSTSNHAWRVSIADLAAYFEVTSQVTHRKRQCNTPGEIP